MGLQISPSILSADFAHLADECAAVSGHADWLHVDVMDNHFVPNLTLGLPIVESLLAVVDTPIDCHLMIEDPDRWAPPTPRRGGQRHVPRRGGACSGAASPRAAPAGIPRRHGAQAATPVDPYAELLGELDMLLLMTVEPGFGGQKFLDLVVPKIRRARELIDGRDVDVWLQVDGGVDLDTITICAEAGANVFVAGSSVYGTGDPAQAVDAARAQAEAAAAEAPPA